MSCPAKFAMDRVLPVDRHRLHDSFDNACYLPSGLVAISFKKAQRVYTSKYYLTKGDGFLPMVQIRSITLKTGLLEELTIYTFRIRYCVLICIPLSIKTKSSSCD
jgi:hypothetical protein